MKKYYAAESGGGGGDKPKAPEAPKNYKALTPVERKDWNDFLNYLDKKGVAGSKDLDARDKGLGLNYMKEYQKLNPKTSVNPDLVQNVQYDQYLLRKGDSFNGMTPEQMNYMRKGFNPAYLARDVSPVDSWLGSITSKLYYPQAYRSDNQGNKYDFGTAIEDYTKGLTDQATNEKYRIK